LNTGGGGGGGGLSGNNVAGNTGGNGIIVLGVPTAIYPRVVTSNAAISNPPAAPGMTVLTYNSLNRTTSNTFTFTISA
jgi:hypothetical protein